MDMEEIDEDALNQAMDNYCEKREEKMLNCSKDNACDTEPSPEHLEVLSRCFGHKSFRPMQWKIINSIINYKRDNCVIMATGYGKSLCYQFPSVYIGGVTIVISPLISLMEDQILALTISGIPSCLLGTAQKKQVEVMGEILDNKYCLVYMSPEFCLGDLGRDLLEKMKKQLSLTLIAVDEAHCVSSWGHDFRFKYRELQILRSILPNVPILAVTATATPNVQNDIITTLRLNNPQILCTGFDRPNLYLQVHLKTLGVGVYCDLRKVMVRRNSQWKFNGCTIVYCITRKQCESTATALQQEGIKCLPYHAGISLKIRKETHEKFVRDKIDAVVATIAFGMGIDKPDVRNVIHYGTSSTLEGYYQEVGRAGRDGLPANCIVYYDLADFRIHKKLREISFGSKETKQRKEKMLEDVKKYLYTQNCRRQFILNYFENKQNTPESIRANCCDNCTEKRRNGEMPHANKSLNEKSLHNFAQDAHILFAAVDAMKGKFGIGMYVLLLRGSNSSKIYKKYKDNILHGSGKHKSEDWWKALASFLIDEGYLNQVKRNENFKYPTVNLSHKGHQFLSEIKRNSETKLMLKPPPHLLKQLNVNTQSNSGWLSKSNIVALNKITTNKVENNKETTEETDTRIKLYKLLLNQRNDLASVHNCMPYMVASNIALMEIARNKPTSLSEMRKYKLDGFPEAKLIRFGDEFVKTVKIFISQLPTQSTNSTDTSDKDFDARLGIFLEICRDVEQELASDSDATIIDDNFDIDMEECEVYKQESPVIPMKKSKISDSARSCILDSPPRDEVPDFCSISSPNLAKKNLSNDFMEVKCEIVEEKPNIVKNDGNSIEEMKSVKKVQKIKINEQKFPPWLRKPKK